MNIPVLIDLSSLTKEEIKTPIENMADRLSAAGQTVVIGMLAVFSVLAILWLVLSIMGKFFTTAPKAEKKQEPAAAPVVVQPVQTNAPVSNDEEIVAAITAAISLMLDKPQSAFRVVSFRQTSREAFRRNNINRN